MRTPVFAFALYALLGAGVMSDSLKPREWPLVGHLDRSYEFKDADHALLRLPIKSLEGKPLYLLDCEGREIPKKPEFEFSGDFECRLTSLYSTGPEHSTLLTDNPEQQRDWESRGRFLSDELYGKCADYPEYGRIRRFRLRAMEIRFELSNLVFARGRRLGDTWDYDLLRSFHFRVTVQPDKSATSPIAEKVPYEQPRELFPGKDGSPLDCNTVRRISPKRSRSP